MFRFFDAAYAKILPFLGALLCSVSLCVNVVRAYTIPGGIVPTGEVGTVVEGLHKFGSPFVTRPMAYSSTGRLVNNIALDAGWGAKIVNVPAETPVFGVVFSYSVRTAATVRNVSKARWCGVLPEAHESLGNGKLFCASDGSGRNESAMSRVFDGPEAVEFSRLAADGTPFYPVELSRFGGSPRIRGAFEVRIEPVEFQKKLWTGMTVSNWSGRFAQMYQLFGEGEKQNSVWLSNDIIPESGKIIKRIGGVNVVFEKADDQHFRVTILR